jgi:hypothetical protein
MSFVADERLDRIREQYKREYDETFYYIHVTPKKEGMGLFLAPLYKRERMLANRTKLFIQKNRFYFNMKRNHIFEMMEKKGVFGTMPDFEKSKGEFYPRTKMPKVIHKQRYCVECGDKFIWYEATPSAMCKKCRNIKPKKTYEQYEKF